MPSSAPRAARPSRRSRLQSFDAATGALSGDVRTIEADCVLVSGGWSPVIHLASQAGGKPQWSAEAQAFLPPEPTQNWIGAGAFTGRFSTAEALAQGHAAGIAATGAPETSVSLPDVAGHELDARPAPVFEIKAKGKAFVDFQHDVTADDVTARASRRLRLGRASEALHHARHGDRPGQDVQRAGPRHHGRRARLGRSTRSARRASARPSRRCRSARSPPNATAS